MEQNYDIIIIGGGLLGCATAYQLSKRNAGKFYFLTGMKLHLRHRHVLLVCLLGRVQSLHLWN